MFICGTTFYSLNPNTKPIGVTPTNTFMNNDSGAIREPFLKLTHIMRSLEFEARSDNPFLRFGMDVQDAIGQSPHKISSVFSFFRPEYKPSGRIAYAGLVSPESQGKQ